MARQSREIGALIYKRESPPSPSGPRGEPPHDPARDPAPNGAPILPLIRHLSVRLTPLLYRTSLTPNQITSLSLLFGLGTWFGVAYGTPFWTVVGALALVACYVLDNCDGEIARMKGLSSRFGAFFDTFVDWIVHAGFFVALGIGTYRATAHEWWIWVGAVAGVGGTINYVLGLYLDRKHSKSADAGTDPSADHEILPESWQHWILFAFRELSRADFCFIVLVLALPGWTWILLPAGAIGAQGYWITQLVKGARDYHV